MCVCVCIPQKTSSTTFAKIRSFGALVLSFYFAGHRGGCVSGQLYAILCVLFVTIMRGRQLTYHYVYIFWTVTRPNVRYMNETWTKLTWKITKPSEHRHFHIFHYCWPFLLPYLYFPYFCFFHINLLKISRKYLYICLWNRARQNSVERKRTRILIQMSLITLFLVLEISSCYSYC